MGYELRRFYVGLVIVYFTIVKFKICQVFNGELVDVFHEYLNLWFGYLKVL